MTRIIFFLLPFFLLSACAPRGTGNASDCAKIGADDADVQSQQLICRVLEFSFCDARPNIKNRIMIGPFRLLGIAEEYTCSSLLPPFCSSVNNFSSFYADGIIDASVAMYSDKRGFSRKYPPCWRLRVTTTMAEDIENIILEVNYSYSYDDDVGSGFVKAMQRLPLRQMDVSSCGVGPAPNDALLFRYYGDENVPFTIMCICFALPNSNFYPL